MQKYYSPSTKGFYDSSIHGEFDAEDSKIPTDAVALTEDQYTAVLEQQAQGAEIGANQGGVYAKFPEGFNREEALAKSAIYARLAEIDRMKIRALTDAVMTQNTTRLNGLEIEAAGLRAKLK